MTEFEEKYRRAIRWTLGDDGAKWAFRTALVLSVGVFYVVGRHQWFTRDDWAYVISREAVRTNSGWQHWLFDAQDGHWLTIPVLIFHFTRVICGLGSYWPFLLPTMGAHVGAVLVTRVICRRVGATAWTTTLICSMLLMFGAGWDNIVFAIQISYNLSLLAFLAQIVLVDHDGPVDRRDYAAVGVGVIGLMSSGFGPIFLVGVVAMLALRRRWRAAMIVGGPQVLLYGWWYITWETDSVRRILPGDHALLPAYVARGLSATFESLVTFSSLAGIAIVATIAVSIWRGQPWTRRTTMLALWMTVLLMFAAIGFERLGFGVPTAASSRYLHIAAIVLAAPLAIAVDRLVAIASEARWAARVVLAAGIAVNVGALRTSASQWAIVSQHEKSLYEWIASSPLQATVDPHVIPSRRSPNVTVQWLPFMIEQGAIHPHPPANDAENLQMLIALGLAPAPSP